MAELVGAAEAVEEVVAVSARNLPLSFGGVVAGLAIGGVVGYFVAEKKLRTKYELLVEEEIAQMREHFHAKTLAMESKPALDGLVKDLGYVPVPTPNPERPVGETLQERIDHAKATEEALAEEDKITAAVERNVFEDQQPELDLENEWDYETEVKFRSPDRPYVIHVDEQGELAELDQLSFTYYEGDDIVANEREEAVTDVDQILGLSNLDKFGHGSGNENIVYIRNVQLGVEIEVIKSPGRFDEEVLGMKHADESYPRKRRFDDD